MVCGTISRVVVLDCDSTQAEEWWRDGIGDLMDETTCVRTQKGHHYWFSLRSDVKKAPSWCSDPESAIKFDVKGDGGGVMTPPSPHPYGGFYEWVRGPDSIILAPPILTDGGRSARRLLAAGSRGAEIPASLRGPGRKAGTRAAAGESGGPQAEETVSETDLGAFATPPDEVGSGVWAPRSLLSQLLKSPPEEGGRNVWLTKVAGHLAKLIPYEDAYWELVKMAAMTMDGEGLDEKEVRKIAQSAWRTQKTKGLDTVETLRERGIVAGEPQDNNGWLVGSGSGLLSPCLVSTAGKDGPKEEILQPWSDFDIKVLGKIQSEGDETGETIDYLVELITQFRHLECTLQGRTLGNSRELTGWLAERQASIMVPMGDMHYKQAESKRLLRYVQSQKAPSYKAVSALGWNDRVGGFVAHEGIIRAGSRGVEDFGDVRPSPILGEWAPYRYGFGGSKRDARAVLQEVLGFHDETVCAVFGSWWAACFLKVQIMAESSLFPFMALEAPSESGKTTGFFALMSQLGGNYEGHGEFTMAALRDRVSGHRNGAVWVDDISDPEAVWDLVRQSTSEGSRTKKQTDRHRQERVALVAPIVISAEGMSALNTEKALSDRAIRLSVPSPTGRTSQKPGREGQPQWDDILDLMARYQRDLTSIAGWFVAGALGHLDRVGEIRTLKPGSGRNADKLGILRFGARVLADLAGTDHVIDLVDGWCVAQNAMYNKGDNILTTEILPWAWRQDGYPTQPSWNATVFYDERRNQFRYHEQSLVDKWLYRRDLTHRQRQLGSLESVKGQRRDLGGEGRGSIVRVGTGREGRRVRFQDLPSEMSALVMERAGHAPSKSKQGELE